MNIIAIVGKRKSGKDTAAKRLVDHHDFTQIAFADPIKRFLLNVFDFTEEQLWGPSTLRNVKDPRYVVCSKLDGKDQAWAAAEERLNSLASSWVEDLIDKPPETEEHQHAMRTLFEWFEQIGEDNPRVSPRIASQTLGTDWARRRVGDLVWVDYMTKIIESLSDENTKYTYSRKAGLIKHKEPQSPTKNFVISDVRFPNEFSLIKQLKGKVIRISRPVLEEKDIDSHESENAQDTIDLNMYDAIVVNDNDIEAYYKSLDTIFSMFIKEQ